MTATAAGRAFPLSRRTLASLRTWMPPVRRREFWVVQGLVVGIALAHSAIEMTGGVDLHGADFLPVSLYLLPVVYAALNFGVRGSAPTAIWALTLSIPNVVLLHQPAHAAGELWQASVVVMVGVFVGQRVDREREARERAEMRERERRASEERYRGLFEVAADPILILDTTGTILEANPTARRLIGSAAHGGGANVASLGWTFDRSVPSGAPYAPFTVDGPSGRLWLEPVAVPFHDAGGNPRILVQLRNVTPSVERQQLLDGLARRMVATREEERRRVARDLHDGPLQSLMLLWRSLDGILDRLPPGARQGVVDGRDHAEQVADELRRFSRDLRPSLLDDLGLVPALKSETAAFGARSGITASFVAKGRPRRLPPEVELTLLRICQEALRNIERHAGATRATVTLEVANDHFRMQVADDGIGIAALPSPSERVRAGQLGLIGMQERARLIGAACTVERGDGGWSTLIVVTGPVSSAGTSNAPGRRAT